MCQYEPRAAPHCPPLAGPPQLLEHATQIYVKESQLHTWEAICKYL